MTTLLRFGHLWVSTCRQLGCYMATLGPFCVTHARLAEDRKVVDQP